jgi:hypothetical protein
MDEPEMAAMLARHQLEDDARLPMFADAENDAFVSPLHRFRAPWAKVLLRP